MNINLFQREKKVLIATHHKFFCSAIKFRTEIQDTPLKFIVLMILGIDIRKMRRSN